MSEYIKREDAIKAFCDRCMLRGKCELDEVYCSNRQKLKEMPAADVRENVRGKWLEVFYGIVCDCCGGVIADGAYERHFMPGGRPNFCPFCGADMRGENNVCGE